MAAMAMYRKFCRLSGLATTAAAVEPAGSRMPPTARAAAPAEPRADHCPKCFSRNVAFESGCSGPTCHDCGYSACS